jgi:hypothetical protein
MLQSRFTLPPHTQRRFLVLISLKRLSQTNGHSAAGRIWKLGKKSITSSGTEPATFGLATKCLNQLRYRVPPLLDTYNNLVGITDGRKPHRTTEETAG